MYRFPKISLHKIHFFHKKSKDPAYSVALGVLVVFMAIGAIWFLAATIRFSGLFYNDPMFNTQNYPDTSIVGEAFVQFDFGVKPSRAFRGSVVKNMTVGEAVEQAAMVGNFEIVWEPEISIDGVSDGMEGKKWVFYKNRNTINEKLATVQVDAQDEIFIRFE